MPDLINSTATDAMVTREVVEHYHCTRCLAFNICIDCSKRGIYCSNDAHEWIKLALDNSGSFEQIATKLQAIDARLPTVDVTNAFSSLFVPPRPDDTPEDLFNNDHRFTRKTDPREILLFTDGSCLRNGESNPQAGCAFVYRPSAYSQDGTLTHGGTIHFSLELEGPTGVNYKHTSNRAELRAVIAVLQFQDWSVDCNAGWRSIVIATDSEYVALGATRWIRRWETDNWMIYDRNAREIEVKNVDLWKLLLKAIRLLQSKGVNVSFWRIPRALNGRADEYARLGAEGTGKHYYEVVVPDGPTRMRFEPWSYYRRTSPQTSADARLPAPSDIQPRTRYFP